MTDEKRQGGETYVRHLIYMLLLGMQKQAQDPQNAPRPGFKRHKATPNTQVHKTSGFMRDTKWSGFTVRPACNAQWRCLRVEDLGLVNGEQCNGGGRRQKTTPKLQVIAESGFMRDTKWSRMAGRPVNNTEGCRRRAGNLDSAAASRITAGAGGTKRHQICKLLRNQGLCATPNGATLRAGR
jgi:hypothetical protein